ncbi:hypothetical protein [Acinetobacter sp. WZC-1]|uniref:hypothetical protein n=1 Tax=Acinetobacter sp. WZC-1 TaxID=3459034 RepID=UPI00403DF049
MTTLNISIENVQELIADQISKSLRSAFTHREFTHDYYHLDGVLTALHQLELISAEEYKTLINGFIYMYLHLPHGGKSQ